jgi:hypothetical protein
LNERVQHKMKRNSMWRIFISLLPCHGSMWPNQFGVTRKLLMTTCGFGVLILSSLYQAKLSQELMTPFRIPVTTLEDIETAVLSGEAKLLFQIEDSPILSYVSTMSNKLGSRHSLHFPGNMDEVEFLNQNNGIFIDGEYNLLKLLTRISPELCENYVYITFDEWTRIYRTLMLRKGQDEMLEFWNQIVAQRVSYFDNNIQSFQLKDECREHIFPIYTANLGYAPLILVEISGAMVLLFTFLSLSILILICEIFYFRRKGDKSEKTTLEKYQLFINFDNTFTLSEREVILSKYVEILDVIEKHAT